MRNSLFLAIAIDLPTHRKYDVIAMIKDAGASPPPTILERTRYTAYGAAQQEPFGDVDGDGVTTLGTRDPNVTSDFEYISAAVAAAADLSDPNTSEAYDPDTDLNRDGLINTADLALLPAQNTLPLPAGQISAQGNTVGDSGYLYDNATNLNLARFRWYDAEEGRWVSRDQFLYDNAPNLYEYVISSPIVLSDPFGLTPNDRLYGLPKEFWNWYHRRNKDRFDPDISHRDAFDEYREWDRQGRPDSDGTRRNKFNRNRRGRPGFIHKRMLRGLLRGLGAVCIADAGLRYNGCLSDAESSMAQGLRTAYSIPCGGDRDSYEKNVKNTYKIDVATCTAKYATQTASCFLPFGF